MVSTTACPLWIALVTPEIALQVLPIPGIPVITFSIASVAPSPARRKPSFIRSIKSASASSIAGFISFRVISATAKKGLSAESFKAIATCFIFSLITGSSKIYIMIIVKRVALCLALSMFSYNLSGSVNETPNNSNILSIIETSNPINLDTNLLTTAIGGSVDNRKID